MKDPTRFGLTALATFVLVIAIGVLAAPTRALALAIYIMLGIVFAPTIAYFFVYLDGFARVASGTNRSDPPTDSTGTADDRTGGSAPPEPDTGPRE